MKKKKAFSTLLEWFKDAGLKVFAVLALLAGGFYAFASITWPVNQPNATSGVVGTFVGQSKVAFVVGSSYADVNAFCSGADGDVQDSHICTPDEIANSYNHENDSSVIKSNPPASTLWINNGPPGYSVNANDCVGWSTVSPGTTDNPNMGTVWNFTAKKGGLIKCMSGKFFACCK